MTAARPLFLITDDDLPMSWLLFLDESGTDHTHSPYEVRGGIAVHAGMIWPLVRRLRAAELESFGAHLRDYRKELKGSKLLDKDRFKWALQGAPMPGDLRRKYSRSFLTKGMERKPPSRDEFTAYGQANIEMARLVFEALRSCDSQLFAGVIPRAARKPEGLVLEEHLRKDLVFLFERFYYFLERRRDHGLLVFDQVEKTSDQRFVRQVEAYFTKTRTGRRRASSIVPVPLFVTSDMTLPIQAADLTIYCVNRGFRLPTQGMDEPVRREIAEEFGPWLHALQYKDHVQQDGRSFDSYGIVFVPNPYGDGRLSGSEQVGCQKEERR
jgi:hypothetical protein